jgi:DNA-binding NtrC family response regulator
MTQSLRVLYAEDNAADADLTRTHLGAEAPSITLDVVNTGKACLERLRGGGYDVLLLDNHLPDMEGVDVLKAVAANGLALPVVMVTGVGDEDLVVQVIRLGAQNYLAKRGDHLEPAEVRGGRTMSVAAGERARRARGILYVEHDVADIDLTARHFVEAAGHFTLEVVRTAAAALTRLGAGGIDLVVTDLRLPDMNALDFLTEARHRRVSIPFIVITGMGDEQAAVAALTLGHGYTSPALLSSCLRHRQRHLPVRAPARCVEAELASGWLAGKTRGCRSLRGARATSSCRSRPTRSAGR